MSKQFYCKQFILEYVHSLVLFNPYIEPYQALPLGVRVDLEAMAVKGYSAFPQAPEFLEPNHSNVFRHIQVTRWWWGLILLYRQTFRVCYSCSQLYYVSIFGWKFMHGNFGKALRSPNHNRNWKSDMKGFF